MSSAFRWVAVFAISMSLSAGTQAAEYVWTGAQSSDWHDAANWHPDTGVPREDDDAIIADLEEDVTIHVSREATIGGLTFDPQARHRCTIQGEAFTFADGAKVIFKRLTKPGEDGSQTIACPIRFTGRFELRNDNRWYLGKERLTLSGTLRGDGELVIMGPPGGTVILSADNSDYSGTVTLESGTLLMANDRALGDGSKAVRIRGGELNTGSRIACKYALVYEVDGRWSGQTYCEMGGTVTVKPDATWAITNGGGCPTKLTAVVKGEGDVHFVNRGTTIAGHEPNTLTGVTSFGGNGRGQTRLAKPDGVTAVAGPVVISASGTLRWEANDQIADHAPLTFNGKQPRLELQGHTETLGTLDLQSDGEIDLGQGDGRMIFADSSEKNWKADAALIIRSAGKSRGTIHVGRNGRGLTAKQLAQVGFYNPAGLRPGTYTARLTPQGELVPTGNMVQPVDLPIDMSSDAYAARKAVYDVPGLERLGGSETPLEKDMVVAVFGDSITWGGGLVRILNKQVRSGVGAKSLGVRFINHGVNGAGVKDILEGQESKNHAGGTKPEPFAKTIAADNADVAVIFIGVNDAWWNKSTPPQYGHMLRELIKQARANGTIPVLASPALLKDSPIERNAELDAYIETMRQVVRETDTVLVDLREAFLACLANEAITVRPGGSWTCNATLLNHDGVHTTGRGDQLLANLIAQGIYEALKKK